MRRQTILAYAAVHELFRSLILSSTATMKVLYLPGFSHLRIFNAKARAYAEFVKAKKNVPAYRNFLKLKGFSEPSINGLIPSIEEIPITDKDSYVRRYSIEERCVHGKLPLKGIVIDESSGSSGTVTNWVRGRKERSTNARFIKFGMLNTFGSDPMFIINAFALGPWATGINVTMSCLPFSKLKSLGPDCVKNENTIRHFGKDHRYVIMGYPPFLKSFVDQSEINWPDFNISFIFGGESMAEGMRDYLLNKGIKKVISSLGASDLELNIAAENDFTISLRRLIRSNEQLQKALLRHTGALPMIFQYNPVDFLLESSPEGELLVTVCRPYYLAPKIRYNLHDRGHVMQISELNLIIKGLGINQKTLTEAKTDLPILFHYGRADMTVSFFGANISPTDIQESIFSFPELAAVVESFKIEISESTEGDKQLVVLMECLKDVSLPATVLNFSSTSFFQELSRINQDFREAQRMLQNSTQTELRFFDYGAGPFAGSNKSIKTKYLT